MLKQWFSSLGGKMIVLVFNCISTQIVIITKKLVYLILYMEILRAHHNIILSIPSVKN